MNVEYLQNIKNTAHKKNSGAGVPKDHR